MNRNERLHLEQQLRMQHPNWSSEKIAWLALQGMGALPNAKR